MSKNRVGLTIRLNIEAQKQMQLMCSFFDKTPRDITMLALNQLYVATGQISKKLAEKQPEEEVCETPSTDSSSESQP